MMVVACATQLSGMQPLPKNYKRRTLSSFCCRKVFHLAHLFTLQIMGPLRVHFVPSRVQGHKHAIYGGCRYHRTRKTSSLWRCEARGCKSCIMIAPDGVVLREPSPHSCGKFVPHSNHTPMQKAETEKWLLSSQPPLNEASRQPVPSFESQMEPTHNEDCAMPPAFNNLLTESTIQDSQNYACNMMAVPTSTPSSGFSFGGCECVDEPCFCHPFTAMCAGATKSGKTEWAKRFVLNAYHLMHPPPDEIIWCFSEYQPSYEELRRNHRVRLVEGLPDIDYLKSTPYKRKLLVMDDLLMEGDGKKSGVTQLFTKGAHHWNCSCIHIVQNLFYGNIRTARINSHYLVLMRNPSDKLQVYQLARQLFPTKQHDFLNAYDDATKEPYGYLVVDLAPNTNEKLRLRSHVFPHEFQCVYLLE